MKLSDRIEQHEGRRNRPYRCSRGKLTVGVGRNIDDVSFSDDEIDLMLKNDIRRARNGAETFLAYQSLNEVRRGVLVEMIFQMGVAGVAKFRKFLEAAYMHEWQTAHDEMLDSRWHKQTPTRAKKLAEIFLHGKHQ